LKEVEGCAAPRGSFREINKPHNVSIYVVLMSKIIDSERSTYEEVVKQQVWKDAIMDEY